MTASGQPRPRRTGVAYLTREYLDVPPGFILYPDTWHLDKDWQATDIADIFSRERRRWKGIYRDLIVEPSVLHLIVRRQFKPRHIKMKGDSK